MTEPFPHRVLHVATSFGVTSETFVADAILSAEDAGWEGWLAALEVHDRARFPHPPDERVMVIPPFSIARRVRDRLLRRSFTERFASSVMDRACAAQPTVVHAHFGWAALYALPLARRLGLPLVCTFHASDVTIFPARAPSSEEVSPTYRELFTRLDQALAVSEYTARGLRDLGWRGPTEIVPAGIRLDRFPLRGAPPAPHPPRLLFVGRLVARKGLDVLLHALARLRAVRHELTLDVIGDGPERPQYESLAVQLGVNGSVRFLGSQGSPEIAAALARAHVMVMPSRTMPSGEVEGSPVVIKEALAVGVPVVATRTGGTEEVLPPSLRDELVPDNDPRALADQIEAVLADPQSWPERARVGRGWVATQFDWALLGRRTAAIYARLDGSKRRA